MAYQKASLSNDFNGERHFVFIEKLVVKAGVHIMVGKVRQLERQNTKESRRSQLGSVVFVAHEY